LSSTKRWISHRVDEEKVPLAIVKVIELVASSNKGWEDAVQDAVREASQSIRHITAVDVVRQTAHVEDGKISEYRVTLHVAFLVEHHSHLIGGSVTGKK
jgi:flavin-binding protein dodecin